MQAQFSAGKCEFPSFSVGVDDLPKPYYTYYNNLNM